MLSEQLQETLPPIIYNTSACTAFFNRPERCADDRIKKSADFERKQIELHRDMTQHVKRIGHYGLDEQQIQVASRTVIWFAEGIAYCQLTSLRDLVESYRLEHATLKKLDTMLDQVNQDLIVALNANREGRQLEISQFHAFHKLFMMWIVDALQNKVASRDAFLRLRLRSRIDQQFARKAHQIWSDSVIQYSWPQNPNVVFTIDPISAASARYYCTANVLLAFMVNRKLKCQCSVDPFALLRESSNNLFVLSQRSLEKFVILIENMSPHHHRLHICANCQKIESRWREFKVCRLCKLQKLNCRSHLCSEKCNQEYWNSTHRFYHWLFDELSSV